MASKGIFINVMPNLEMGALGAAVTKLKDIFNQAGVDAGKAFDTATSVLLRRVE